MNSEDGSRPLALVTGASRRKGIGAAIALELARGGWDVATTFWRAYDQTMPWGSDPADADWLRVQDVVRPLASYTLVTARVPIKEADRSWRVRCATLPLEGLLCTTARGSWVA